MYSFLVLGVVPGTNIQITFGVWLSMLAAFVVAAAAVLLYLRRIGKAEQAKTVQPA
jgi:large-conductance mechanosensitive channel